MIPLAKPLIDEAEHRAVAAVLDSGMLAQGPQVRAFEEAFAAMCGVAHAVATSSGTTALHLALLAHGIGPGDEVITTPFTFIASANSIRFVGATPVFVDIDPHSYTIDPAQVEAALTPRSRAIMPIHLYGLMADMDPILAIAERQGLVLIEDACQAHGARYRGRRAGAFGTGAFSLYPTKNITSGEGGMITTDDPALAERCRLLREHGMRQRYHHEILGYNFRMTDLHAAIGLAQLGKLEAFNAARAANAAYLCRHLRGVAPPHVPPDREHVFHQFTVRVPGGRRDALRAHLSAAGIGNDVYYPIPVHRQACYRDIVDPALQLPESERAAEEVLSLPVHPGLSEAELAAVAATVNRFSDAA